MRLIAVASVPINNIQKCKLLTKPSMGLVWMCFYYRKLTRLPLYFFQTSQTKSEIQCINLFTNQDLIIVSLNFLKSKKKLNVLA